MLPRTTSTPSLLRLLSTVRLIFWFLCLALGAAGLHQEHSLQAASVAMLQAKE